MSMQLIGPKFWSRVPPPSPPSVQRMNSIEAITSTLESVFSRSSEQQSNQRAKRTVLQRSSGQIMTEQDVINQIEQQQAKKTKKTTIQNVRKKPKN